MECENCNSPNVIELKLEEPFLDMDTQEIIIFLTRCQDCGIILAVQPT